MSAASAPATRFWALEWLIRGREPPSDVLRETLDREFEEIARTIGRMRRREITPQAVSNLYKITVNDVHLLSLQVRQKAQKLQCEDGTVKVVYRYYLRP